MKNTVTATLAHPFKKYAGIVDIVSHIRRTAISFQFFFISSSNLRVVVITRIDEPVCVRASRWTVFDACPHFGQVA